MTELHAAWARPPLPSPTSRRPSISLQYRSRTLTRHVCPYLPAGSLWTSNGSVSSMGEQEVALKQCSAPNKRPGSFAERHARSITPSGIPLKWDDASESTMLTTQLGDYLIARIGDD